MINEPRAAFEAIATLLQDLGPRIDRIEDVDNDVFMETSAIMMEGGQIAARVWGPWRTKEDGELYLATKRKRNKIRAEEHFAKGGYPEHDGHFMCHPSFQYRFIAASEYMARYLAQISMTATGGLVSLTLSPDSEQEFRTPQENDDGET
jgi:hypothetical protein